MRLRISIVIILFICLFLLITGCQFRKKSVTEPFYEEKLINLDELCGEDKINSYEVKDVVKNQDNTYILLEAWGDCEQNQVIYRIKDDGISLIRSWNIGVDTFSKAMDIDKEGNYYILEEKKEDNRLHPSIKYVENKTDLVHYYSLEKYVGESDSVKNIMCGEKNIYIFLEFGKIIVFSRKLEWEGEITEHEGEYFIDAAYRNDGKVICVYANYLGDEEILGLYEVGKTSTTKMQELPKGRYGSNILLNGNDEYSFCVKGEFELLGAKDSNELTPVFRFQDLDIQSSEIVFLNFMDNGRFLAVKESEKTELSYIIKGHKKGENKKIVLNLASLNKDSLIEKEVAKFNKTNDKYRINIKRYGEYEEPLQNFLVDMSAGVKFDLVEIPINENDKIVEKGILSDLYPFIDSDEIIKRDDFYKNMLEAFENEGRLYQSVSFVHLFGWVTKQSQLRNIGRWDIESVQSFMEQNPEINIFTDASGEEILKQMIFVSSKELIDWKRHNCKFDSDEFKNILMLARNYGMGRSKIREADKVSALLEDRLLFVETPISIEDFCVYHKVLGEDMTVVASPYVKQSGVNLYSTMPQIGIISNSKYKDGAWQFARIFFTKEYQDISDDASFQMTDYLGFPVRKDCMEDLLRRFTATEDYEKDGKWYTAIKTNDYSIRWDEFDINIGPLDESEEKMLRELLLNSKQKQEVDPLIWNIVLDESRCFFSGEKSLEETTKIIQNRVTIYMNE